MDTVGNHLLSTIPLDSLANINTTLDGGLTGVGLRAIRSLLLRLPLHCRSHARLCPVKRLLPNICTAIRNRILGYGVSFNNQQVVAYRVDSNSNVLAVHFFGFDTTVGGDLTANHHMLTCNRTGHNGCNTRVVRPRCHIRNSLDAPRLRRALAPICPAARNMGRTALHGLASRTLSLLSAYTVRRLLPPRLSRKVVALPRTLHALRHPPPALRLDSLRAKRRPTRHHLVLRRLLTRGLDVLTLHTKTRHFRTRPLDTGSTLGGGLLTTLPFGPANTRTHMITRVRHSVTLSIPVVHLMRNSMNSNGALITTLTTLHTVTRNGRITLVTPARLLTRRRTGGFHG